MVPRQNIFQRPAFPATRGTTQGGLLSLTLFNVVVNNFIRNWLDMTVEDQRVAHGGLRENIGRCLRVFYSKDYIVVLCDSDWLHHVMTILVGLFRRYILAANVAKSYTMIFQPGALQAGMSEKAMVMKCMGVVDSYRVRL